MILGTHNSVTSGKLVRWQRPFAWLLHFCYSKRMALVGSMREMSIEGNTSIATDNANIAMLRGISHHENSMGTLSI